MDILKFINSKDIREYLQKINYQFTPIEAAWLVWKSTNTTLKENHTAWGEIIKTMPDCRIEKHLNQLQIELIDFDGGVN